MEGDAVGVGQVDVAVRVVGQQVFHDAVRHFNQLAVLRQNHLQPVRGRRVIDKLLGVDAVFARTLPGLQDRLADPAGLPAFIKNLPALPKQAIPFTGLRASREAENRVALVFDRHQSGGSVHAALQFGM
ncbi:hypothetical protein D3C79_496300 [compost metagenome]